MSHFAQVKNSIVQQVIVAEQDFINSLPDSADWIQTSYNTRGNVHYDSNTNEPDGGIALRYNYAGIGYTYDIEKDAFIPPSPFPSWELDENTCLWQSPIPYPTDENSYFWNEEEKQWMLLNSSTQSLELI